MRVFTFCTLGLLLFLFNQSTMIDGKPAQRIIALSPHSVEMLFAIGAGERIIATLEFADYPQAALAIPRIGNFTGIQIEKVIQLQPDLIIAWRSGNKAADLSKLESLGFNLYYSLPANIAGISLELLRLGQLTGLNEKAETVARRVTLQHDKIKENYRNKRHIRVFYQLWNDPLRTIGPNNWIQSLINDCNGINIFDEAMTAYPMVSLETVLLKNPEVIIIPHQSGTRELKNTRWEKWQHLSAVKENNIVSIDADLLHRFSPRAIAGLELLCQAIDKARKEKTQG